MKNDTNWIYYTIDEVNDLAVLTLTECNYNEEYLSVLDEFFNEVMDNGINNI